MPFELTDAAFVIKQEIDEGLPRAAIAVTYALALQSSQEQDWKTINRMILMRWSPSGLEYIKREAWKMVEKP